MAKRKVHSIKGHSMHTRKSNEKHIKDFKNTPSKVKLKGARKRA